MIVSLDDAVALLSKWHTESVPLVCIAAVDGGGVTFSGFISTLNSTVFVVSHFLSQDQKAVESVMDLRTATTLDYQDLREAEPDVREKLTGKFVSLLAIYFPTSQWCLYEAEAETDTSTEP